MFFKNINIKTHANNNSVLIYLNQTIKKKKIFFFNFT